MFTVWDLAHWYCITILLVDTNSCCLSLCGVWYLQKKGKANVASLSPLCSSIIALLCFDCYLSPVICPVTISYCFVLILVRISFNLNRFWFRSYWSDIMAFLSLSLWYCIWQVLLLICFMVISSHAHERFKSLKRRHHSSHAFVGITKNKANFFLCSHAYFPLLTP